MPATTMPATRARVDGSEGVYDFVPKLGREYFAPYHLDPLVKALELSWTQPVYQTAHAPPRHAKTDTILAWIALTIRKFPWETIGYVTYEANLARSKSRKARNWAAFAGVKFDPGAQRLDEWRTTDGGGLIAIGIDGPFTGKGVNKLVVDDPYKNRKQAESAAYRRTVKDWWGDVSGTRIEPGGSAFISHTRWVEDDLIGYVTSEENDDEGDAERWAPHILLPAISEAGAPLWGQRWSLQALERKRNKVGPHTWASLYQGSPRPRGGAVFNKAHRYSKSAAPTQGFRRGIGLDFAYSAKKKADYCSAVVVDAIDFGDFARFYIRHVFRKQMTTPQFAAVLEELAATWNCHDFYAYIAGTEIGIVDLIHELTGGVEGGGIKVSVMSASGGGDKFIRAQPVAAKWNQGHVFVPEEESELDWVRPFLAEVTTFTGAGDANDDQVDALAGVYDELASYPEPYESHRRR